MELRELEYFLAITKQGSISEAARSLHMTQPALTRSLKHLEDELGKPLIIRGRRGTELTEEGRILKARAEDLLRMADRTVSEIRASEDVIEGDIYVTSGETKALHFLTQAFRGLQVKYPGLRLHISSGDAKDVMDDLENGLADFGLLFMPFDTQRYDSIRIPFSDTWGFLMRKDDPLAALSHITSSDIIGKPLIVSREIQSKGRLGHLLTPQAAEFKNALKVFYYYTHDHAWCRLHVSSWRTADPDIHAERSDRRRYFPQLAFRDGFEQIL